MTLVFLGIGVGVRLIIDWYVDDEVKGISSC